MIVAIALVRAAIVIVVAQWPLPVALGSARTRAHVVQLGLRRRLQLRRLWLRRPTAGLALVVPTPPIAIIIAAALAVVLPRVAIVARWRAAIVVAWWQAAVVVRRRRAVIVAVVGRRRALLMAAVRAREPVMRVCADKQQTECLVVCAMRPCIGENIMRVQILTPRALLRLSSIEALPHTGQLPWDRVARCERAQYLQDCLLWARPCSSSGDEPCTADPACKL